jgi:hypothetical protein
MAHPGDRHAEDLRPLAPSEMHERLRLIWLNHQHYAIASEWLGRRVSEGISAAV